MNTSSRLFSMGRRSTSTLGLVLVVRSATGSQLELLTCRVYILYNDLGSNYF